MTGVQIAQCGGVSVGYFGKVGSDVRLACPHVAILCRSLSSINISSCTAYLFGVVVWKAVVIFGAC